MTTVGVPRASLTVDEYLAAVPHAYLIPHAEFVVDGRRLDGRCPCVVDNSLDDWAAAYPGFVILNLGWLQKAPTPVKLWIYYHEAHHARFGPDEFAADRAAVERGVRDGWLDHSGLEIVCNFISAAAGDAEHLPGPTRAAAMRNTYRECTSY